MELAESEVGAALTMARSRAATLIALAATLRDRLPLVRAAMARGELDLYRTTLIEHATRNVTPELIAAVEREALEKVLAPTSPGGTGLTGRRLSNAITRIVGHLDPAGVRERRIRAAGERHIGVSAAEDAMTTLWGALPAADGRKFDTRLRELANTACPADGRTFAQRKADSVTALVDGLDYLPCACGREDCPQQRGNLPTARKPLIHLILLDSTLQGQDEEPGYLDGYGLVDAHHARNLTTDAELVYVRVPTDIHCHPTDTTADTTGAGTHTSDDSPTAAEPIDPTTIDTGADGVLPASAYTYRPNTVLDTWIRILCGTCQWLHCDAPAWATDLDHDVPFNHAHPDRGGTTTAAGMKAYCRFHHRIKHSGTWTEHHRPDRTMEYISPTGHRYHSRAAGYLDLLGINPDDIADPDTSARRRRARTENKAARIRDERRHQQTRIDLKRIRPTGTNAHTNSNSKPPPDDDVPCPF